jgi:hypothetical protein
MTKALVIKTIKSQDFFAFHRNPLRLHAKKPPEGGFSF